MKTTRQRMMAAVMTASILLAGGAWAGNLTPPGAPGSTMKTLDEIHTAVENVKSRIDLATVAGVTTAHYYITEPGSYFLSGNIDVSKTYGILVNSDNDTQRQDSRIDSWN